MPTYKSRYELRIMYTKNIEKLYSLDKTRDKQSLDYARDTRLAYTQNTLSECLRAYCLKVVYHEQPFDFAQGTRFVEANNLVGNFRWLATSESRVHRGTNRVDMPVESWNSIQGFVFDWYDALQGAGVVP